MTVKIYCVGDNSGEVASGYWEWLLNLFTYLFLHFTFTLFIIFILFFILIQFQYLVFSNLLVLI